MLTQQFKHVFSFILCAKVIKTRIPFRMTSLQNILLALLFSVSSLTSASQKLSICTDANFWYPFTYVKNNQSVGLHIDIIDQALRNLGFEAQYKPLPWKQCLKEAANGRFDAVATLSYKDDRAIFLNYPEGAANDNKSPWRVTQVDYVVITPSTNKKGEKNDYVFHGQVKTIPEPIRVPAGYSIINYLKNEGLKVEEGKSSEKNLSKLLKEKTGSVVDLEDIVKYYDTLPEYNGKFIIQSQPIASKSYYLAFTKEGKLNLEEAQRIWAEIAKVRDDNALMAKFLKKY